jgi:hypothetical protein
MDEAAVEEEEVFPDTPLMPRDTEDHDVFEEHVVKFKSALAGEVAARRPAVDRCRALL